MNTRNSLLALIPAALCLALVYAGATTARAGTITVTSTADSGPGTLRDALGSAADGDTIDASGISGTISLTSGGLFVAHSMDIIGPGPSLLAINGNGAGRVFQIGPGKTVTICSLTVANGRSDYGGGIFNDHSILTVTNCAVSGSRANSGGGGIFNYGEAPGSATLTIVDSTISGNNGGNNGGGVINDGGHGGSAILKIANCTLSGNLAENGGGISNYTLDNGSGTITIINSTISGNSARLGGGIGSNGGSVVLKIVNCTLSSNSAQYGGGIYKDSAILEIGNSTVSDNSALIGGGIYNNGASLMIANCTLSGNSASISGGGIYNRATLEIGNTILKAGPSGVNIFNDGGTVMSLGYDLSDDDGGGFLTAIGDQTNTDPMLGPLQDNGGPTFTHALLSDSPAVDKGKNFTASATDQRGSGFCRIVDDPAVSNTSGGDGTDIGSFEVQRGVCDQPPVAQCKNVTVSIDGDCMADASVDDGSFDPDAGDSITLSQSPAGPYSLGTTPVTLTVTDSHGAQSSCTAMVTVRESTAPTITCPANLITNTMAEMCSRVVTFAPVVSDNCDPNPTVICTPASGSTFVKGTTFVTCRAFNASGNTNTCAFTVTVVDTIPPTITCTSNGIVNATSPAGAVVNFPSPVASDNCSVASVSCSPASGSTFPIGTTTVTCQAIDDSANTNTCTFTVRVKGAAEQINDLIALVQSFYLKTATANSLIAKLQSAASVLSNGNVKGACGNLADFISLVKAQKDKKQLTAGQADLLIGEATRIRAVLGC